MMMRSKKNLNDGAKLGAGDIILFSVLILSVVVLFVISMVNYSETYDSTVEYASTSISNRTEQSAKEIEAEFEKKFELLEYLATVPEISNMTWKEQYAYIKANQGNMGFEQLFIMDMNGNGYYVRDNVIKDQKNEPFFASISEVDRFITEPFMDFGASKSITTLCTSIYKDNTKSGILCAAMDLQGIYDLVEAMSTNNEEVVIVNSAGEYVASSDMTLVHRKVNISSYYSNEEKHDVSFIKDNLKNTVNVTGEVTIDGKEYFTCITNIKDTDWKIILTVPKEDAVGEFEGMYITQLASVLILIIIILVTIRFILKLNAKEKVAFIDGTTGINNRARCTIMMDKYETNIHESIMVVNFDLNDFKQINDKYGHKVGDDALKQFARILVKSFGKEGFVGRMGGDEFICILVNKTQEEYEELLKEMQNQLNALNANKDQKYLLSPAYGNAIRSVDNPEGKTVRDLYDEADKNMYFYKETYKSIRNQANK